MTESRSTAGDLKAAGRDGGPAQGRHQAQPGADPGEHPGPHPRRPLCQHRPRLQLACRPPSWPSSWRTTAITEAGFGADLGAEKFLDIKCRMAGLRPVGGGAGGHHACAQVQRRRAPRPSSPSENVEALKKGLPNLEAARRQHAEITACRCVVAINRFGTDTEAEIAVLVRVPCAEERRSLLAVRTSLPRAAKAAWTWPRRSCAACEEPNATSTPSTSWIAPIEEKIETICPGDLRRRRGGTTPPPRKKAIKDIDCPGLGRPAHLHGQDPVLPLGQPEAAGPPEGLHHHMCGEVRLSAGAGFIVAQTGDIMTMPGLPKVPAANQHRCGRGRSASSGLF